MSGLTFTLRNATAGRLDLSALVPNKLAGLEVRDIAKLVIGKTRDQLRAGDVFDISGTLSDTITFAGTTAECDGIGAALETGVEVVVFEVWIRRENFITGTTGAEQVEDVANRHAHPADAWTSCHDGRIHGDAVEFVHAPKHYPSRRENARRESLPDDRPPQPCCGLLVEN